MSDFKFIQATPKTIQAIKAAHDLSKLSQKEGGVKALLSLRFNEEIKKQRKAFQIYTVVKDGQYYLCMNKGIIQNFPCQNTILKIECNFTDNTDIQPINLTPLTEGMWSVYLVIKIKLEDNVLIKTPTLLIVQGDIDFNIGQYGLDTFLLGKILVELNNQSKTFKIKQTSKFTGNQIIYDYDNIPFGVSYIFEEIPSILTPNKFLKVDSIYVKAGELNYNQKCIKIENTLIKPSLNTGANIHYLYLFYGTNPENNQVGISYKLSDVQIVGKFKVKLTNPLTSNEFECIPNCIKLLKIQNEDNKLRTSTRLWQGGNIQINDEVNLVKISNEDEIPGYLFDKIDYESYLSGAVISSETDTFNYQKMLIGWNWKGIPGWNEDGYLTLNYKNNTPLWEQAGTIRLSSNDLNLNFLPDLIHAGDGITIQKNSDGLTFSTSTDPSEGGIKQLIARK